MMQYVRPHQTLAMNRGEKQGFLSVKVKFEEDLEGRLHYEIGKLCNFVPVRRDHHHASHNPTNGKKPSKSSKSGPTFITAVDLLRSALRDGIKRLLLPSYGRAIRSLLKAVAFESVLATFRLTLRNTLLKPPHVVKSAILGLDPAGFRTGIKVAVLGEGGTTRRSFSFPHTLKLTPTSLLPRIVQ